ncbi:hypothetical protein CLV81_0362 [Flagellimonas meridianipacifica]|uniref:Uncharacterized protein n=2 Tax=Flagellimonas meridianipacifica TaxID=1080225 RepID=A0A2T0MFQ3_9FLAO|nr:hypothetical protein CLV81_0362 [Allomuricauda pacifica]
MYYLVKYIDPDFKSNPIVMEYNHFNQISEITEAYDDWYRTTLENSRKLISTLSIGDLKTYSKALIKHKKNENRFENKIQALIPESPYTDGEAREQVGFFKLPLLLRTKELKAFKDHFHSLFKQHYSTDEIDAMFVNSFKLNVEPRPNEYLNLKVSDSKWLSAQFHKLYKYYNSEIKNHNEFVTKKRNEQVDKIPSNRRKYAVNIPSAKVLKMGSRNDFAKLMFCNFKEIREAYYKKKLKLGQYPLSKYLLNMGKNICERK